MFSNFHLIVHIGTGKTGSSSIQKTLAAHKPQLEKLKVAYLGLMLEESQVPDKFSWQRTAGWPELRQLGLEKSRHQLQTALVKTLEELSDGGYQTAIWSNESIFGNDKLILPILLKLNSLGVKISVVVYVRRHDSWARSAYLQWGIKHKTYTGQLKSFRDWYKDRPISFFTGLKPWTETEKVEFYVRNFDSCGDVVTDFLELYGLKSENIKVKRANETPNSVALTLWAMYNAQFDKTVLPVELNSLLNDTGLLGRLVRDCDLSRLLPNSEDINFVQKDCHKDRDLVNKILKDYRQPEIEVSPLKAKNMDVSQSQINAALLFIVKDQHERINNTERRLRRLEKILENKT